MPGVNANEVTIAGTGKVLVAPVGTAAPADLVTAFSGTWIDLGYTTEDGVTFTRGRDVNETPAWQSRYPVRRTVTGETFRAAFSLLQWNDPNVIFAFGGGTVTVPSGGVFKYEPPDAGSTDERALAIELTDGTKITRVFIPRGEVAEEVETQMRSTEASLLPITFAALGSAGVKPWYFISNDPAMNPAA